eukprot:927126-Amphidinium_carterae.1
MDASLDAERLLSERQKKRTRTADTEFKEKRQEMDREEYANMFSSSASAQKPKGPPPPPPKVPPPRGETYQEPKMKAPPTPKGAPASSSSSGT